MPVEQLTVVPVERAPRTLYRVVTTDDRESAALVDCFKSSHALGLPPRQGSPEDRFCLIHSGVSFYKTCRQAEKVAIRWSKGDYIAEVELQPGNGICLAEWGSRGHVTVWAEPVKLVGMTVDIQAVRQES